MIAASAENAPGSRRPTIVRWGDSLTQQGDDARLSALTRAAVLNAGVGGETSTTVAARMGAIPVTAHVSAGSRPGEHLLSFISPADFRPLLQGSGTANSLLAGWLDGVPGVVFPREDVAGDHVFVADDESRTPRAGRAAFIPDVHDAYLSGIGVLWVGRNNFSDMRTVIEDLGAMVARLTTDRFLVLTVLHGEGDHPLSTTGRAITTLNAAISATWTDHVLDVDEELRRVYAVQEEEAWVVPARIRKDAVHLTAEGQSAVSELIAAACRQRGWV
ncbi:hypothetical protein DY023_00620 [Microbacterium bovistercoris]|uniref:SGNH/GDSL hydrolase family protein n=1 Tax=Microbacterium bovistercoris TaxID=2293570 RepID=A0A371NYK7_9MICO|nr:hypothetical protein [Microbacterium bovistercoris]REJ08507.1 hypothetical protein DY023_00620 [Microbacterium bovistercoris]